MIRCRGLQWGPPGRPLTPALDLDLASGSLTAVVGPNGSGKSSLLKVIAGWQAPLAGQVRVDAPTPGGIACLAQQQAFDRQFPISLQALVAGGLWPHRGSRARQREAVDQALRGWHLEGLGARPLEALSGGQLQRALLARLGLTRARVLLLDEPEAALDEAGQALFWQHARQWRAEGRTLVVVSHALDRLRQQVDQGLLIAPDGCLLAPVAELATHHLPRAA